MHAKIRTPLPKITIPSYNSRMNTVANVKKVSLIFFLLLAGAHILSSLLLARGYMSNTLLMINGTADIPALLAGILYAFSSMKLYLEEIGKNTGIFDIVAGIIGGVIIIGAVYINFFY